MLRKTLFAALVVTVTTSQVLAACSCSDADPAPVAPPAKASALEVVPAKVPVVASAAAPAAKGAIHGMVKFEGTAPERSKVDLSPDPICVKAHEGTGMMTPGGVQAGAGGGLADVFVQLTTGLPADKKYEAPAEPAVIDQIGCTYVPHVLGVVKKQKIEIRNSDPTLHNIHAQPKTNKEFNLAMPNKDDKREVEFKKGEDAIHIKCDVHPWMSAFCFCLEHPFFAVTGADGSFDINMADLPDGEYGIKLWHETLGTQEGKVTVKDGAGSCDFTFKK